MMTEQEIERQQHVIQYVVQTLLSAQQTERAVNIWQTSFSGEKLFLTKILLFANQLKTELELDVTQKQELLRSCIQQRALTEQELTEKESTPTAVLDKNKYLLERVELGDKPQDTIPTPLSTEMILFNALLQEIVVDTTDALQGEYGSFKVSLLTQISSIKLDEPIAQSLRQWCLSIGEGDLYMLEGGLTREGMSDILDVIYEVLCDELGAIEADGLLAKAMHDVDKIDEARQFSVNQLF